MKHAKLWVSMLLIALFAAACSGGGGGGNDGNNGGDAVVKPEVKLQFMGWEASPLETEAVKKGLEAFMKLHPNIKVEYQPVPGGAQYVQKLLSQLAGNSAPDVFFLGATEYRTFQERGVLLDLTERFEGAMSLNDFIPSAANIMSIDGSIYGVSSCTVSPVLYYNKALFDAAGIPYPPSNPDKAWTWDEFREAAKALTIKEGDNVKQYGAFGFENFYVTSAQILSNGGQIFNDDVTEMRLNSPEAQEVFQAVYDLREADGAAPSAKTLESIGMKANQMLQTGRTAMVADGSWALQELASMDFEVGVAPLPSFDGAKTHGQAHVHAAAKNTKHPDEAWELIKFLSSEDYQIDLISEGLWMPNRQSLYTEEGIDRWFNAEVHPEGFRELVPFFAEADSYPIALGTKAIVNDIITEETDKLWYAGQSVADTTANIESRSNAELAK